LTEEWAGDKLALNSFKETYMATAIFMIDHQLRRELATTIGRKLNATVIFCETEKETLTFNDAVKEAVRLKRNIVFAVKLNRSTTRRSLIRSLGNGYETIAVVHHRTAECKDFIPYYPAQITEGFGAIMGLNKFLGSINARPCS
jgi:hypothetical protein